MVKRKIEDIFLHIRTDGSAYGCKGVENSNRLIENIKELRSKHRCLINLPLANVQMLQRIALRGLYIEGNARMLRRGDVNEFRYIGHGETETENTNGI